jgi:hypothetical protein
MAMGGEKERRSAQLRQRQAASVKFHWIARENNFVATPAEFGLVGRLPLDLQRLLLNPKYKTLPDVLFSKASLSSSNGYCRPLCNSSAPLIAVCPVKSLAVGAAAKVLDSPCHGLGTTRLNFNFAIFAPDGLSHLI